MTAEPSRWRLARRSLPALLALQWAIAHPAPATTPTPTPTPCDTSGAQLELRVSAQPADPEVGDVVELAITITNPSGRLAGLPSYSLVGAAPLFTAELVEHSYPLPEFARYRLTAVATGQATLWASVAYETAHDCFGFPTFFFRSSRSDPFVIDVRAPGGATHTPTPTVTPSPTSNRPPPVAVVDAGPDPARAGERVDLDSRRSHGAINGRYWRQLAGPAVELQGCTASDLGCRGDTAWFVAPVVTQPVALQFELLLTSYGSTSWDRRQVEIRILPPACAGDCDGDGRVTVAELVGAVSIALGSAPVAACAAVDADASGAVTIAELVTARNAALDGCAALRPAGR